MQLRYKENLKYQTLKILMNLYNKEKEISLQINFNEPIFNFNDLLYNIY